MLPAALERSPDISGLYTLFEGSSFSRLEVLVLWRVIDLGRICNKSEMVSHGLACLSTASANRINEHDRSCMTLKEKSLK
jgi:hypothetical protein